MTRLWLITLALFASAAVTRAAEPHYLVDNCSSPIPNSPAITFFVDSKAPKVGLGALEADYSFPAEQHQVEFEPPQQRWLLPASGKLLFWLKGDGSTNELQFVTYTGQVRIEPDGRRSMINVAGADLPRVKLDSKEWTEVSLDASAPMPPNSVRWIGRVRLFGNSQADKNAPPPAKFEGTIELDDIRLLPAPGTPAPTSAVSTSLLGPAVRDFTSDFAVSLDARNFTASGAAIKVRLSMTDRNQNAVVDRDFNLKLDANGSNEFKLDLAPENIKLFLPPFHVTGDVMSPDLATLASRIDVNVVMANSRILFDNLADVDGQWLTRGYPAAPGKSIDQEFRNWIEWTQGEGARAVPWTQTTAKISRIVIDRPAGVDPKSLPPDRFAMKFEYAGQAAAYKGFDRYLPGNAFKFGIWIKGDGSNNRLIGNFLDYSDLSDFWPGGWKRVYDGHRVICRLNFTDWRYIEVPLPGDGIGTNTLRGSTEGIDFPIELNSLAVLPDPIPDKPDPAKPAAPQSGTILIGPMFADTQQTPATTLAVMIGYDDPKLDYAPQHGASVSVQNAWRTGIRKVEAEWTLADKQNQPVVSGKQALEIPAGEIRSFRIELAGEAAKIASRTGPLRLQVVASDAQDLTTHQTKEIALAKPDSVVLLADFESDRGYLGTRAEGVTNAPEKGEAAARTSTAQHHNGNRSLEIQWDKEKNATRFVAVDPPIPGISIDVKMWVKGDGSGALFYPVIGGPSGVRAGLGTRTWNLFVPRAAAGDLQDAIRLDFTDWRELTFHFSPVAPNFDKPLPVLPFLPSYPQGLHLAVDARDAKGTGGSVFVDDVSIRTHLDPANRLGFVLRRDSESNVVRPDAKISFVASNYDAAAPRKAHISGGVYNWRGEQVAPLESTLELKPAESRDVVLSQQLPPGAYELRVQMKEGDRLVESITQDLVVADLSPILGPEWQAALKDRWKLRVPIKDDFTYLDEDWDWVENFPGNVQTDSMRNRFALAKANGAKPWMLLGFSALWSAGTTFEQMQAGALNRGPRDVGHGVDIFQVPQRDDDWDNYNLEVMRSVGKDVAGWVLWDNPDGNSSIAMPPKRLASLIKISDKWRTTYCPKTPLIIGGMGRATAIPYLQQLQKEEALTHVSGVNVRMDVGRLSPEDAQVLPYARLLRETLAAGGPETNVITLSELDWAVEKSPEGLNVFDQAAYLARSELLLSLASVRPTLKITNEDSERLGTGLAYRDELYVPPMREKLLTHNLKPAWLAIFKTRELLSQLKTVDLLTVQDTTPQRTQGVLFERTADGRAVAIIWRNDDPGMTTFAHTGLNVESAQDLFGAPVMANDGWYAIGKMPVVFTLASPAATSAEPLHRIWIRDGADSAWPQRVIAQFGATGAESPGYTQTGGTPTILAGKSPTGVVEELKGLAFASGGSETLSIDVPAGSGIVLRKRYRLDKTGQTALISVNGKPAGTWNMKRSEAALSEGLREAIYVIDAAALSGQPKAQVEIKYDGPSNTIGWTAFEFRGGDFPLAAVGPIHADQQAGPIRLGRNMVGGQLKVDVETFSSGIGAYANSLLEYPINGQFKRFTAKAGVDAATEGKGSVLFEVWGDGKKLWSSGIMSGLDRAKPIDVDVTGVNRLRLILNDAGDGNKFDAGDWCEPVLKR